MRLGPNSERACLKTSQNICTTDWEHWHDPPCHIMACPDKKYILNRTHYLFLGSLRLFSCIILTVSADRGLGEHCFKTLYVKYVNRDGTVL